MPLCLTITSYHKITPGQCSEKSMDQGVMAIGRNSDNTGYYRTLSAWFPVTIALSNTKTGVII